MLLTREGLLTQVSNLQQQLKNNNIWQKLLEQQFRITFSNIVIDILL